MTGRRWATAGLYLLLTVQVLLMAAGRNLRVAGADAHVVAAGQAVLTAPSALVLVGVLATPAAAAWAGWRLAARPGAAWLGVTAWLLALAAVLAVPRA